MDPMNIGGDISENVEKRTSRATGSKGYNEFNNRQKYIVLCIIGKGLIS